MISFIAILQASQNTHRILHAGLAHIHLLESSLERSVLLNVFLVFLQGCGSDDSQFASRKHWLQQIRSVHRAVRLSSAQKQVHLIDKQNDLALALLHFVHHSLQSLFELSSVFGTCDQSSQVQRDQADAKGFRDIALDDSVRETFHDCRLSHTRLTDQNRVVLGSTTQNSDHATDFLVTTNHRIDLSLLSLLHKIDSVLVQSVVRTLRSVRIGLSRSSLLLNRVIQLLLRQTHTLEQGLHRRVVKHSSQHMVLSHTRVLLRSSVLLSNT